MDETASTNPFSSKFGQRRGASLSNIGMSIFGEIWAHFILNKIERTIVLNGKQLIFGYVPLRFPYHTINMHCVKGKAMPRTILRPPCDARTTLLINLGEGDSAKLSFFDKSAEKISQEIKIFHAMRNKFSQNSRKIKFPEGNLVLN